MPEVTSRASHLQDEAARQAKLGRPRPASEDRVALALKFGQQG